jgi:hypothetical protein
MSNEPTVSRRLAEWGLANAMKQKFELENAVIERQIGRAIETVPFGNQITVHQNSESAARDGLLGKAVLAGAALLGLGAGGLGLSSMTGLFTRAAAPPAPLLSSEELPLKVDWELIESPGADDGEAQGKEK